MQWLNLAQFILPLILVLLGWVVGRILEKRHYASIRQREQALAHVLVFSTRLPPPNVALHRSSLVTGSVVVSSDYFKTFVAGLRNLVGGNFKGYETLMERGRREALLRLKADALAQGSTLVIGLRFESSRIAGSQTPCMEVLAYGTALTA